MTGTWKRWAARLILAIPSFICITGLVLVAVFGWRYLWQTLWVNKRPLPAYEPAPGTARLWAVPPAKGVKIGELVFPSQHVEVPVVQGTDWTALELGAGHYIPSALPGQGGNVYVAGHRDTVFQVLRKLRPGDVIDFQTAYGDFVYRATSFEVVWPTETRVLAPTRYETLTLQTCYPFSFFGFAPMRYIVHTRLVSGPAGTRA